MTDIRMMTEDIESLISRRMIMDLIEHDQKFFKNNSEKVEALRACADLWDHELVNDTKNLQEATRRLIIQKLSKLKNGNVLSFPR